MVEQNITGRPEIGLKHEEKIIKAEEIHHILKPGEFGAVYDLIITDPKTGKITEQRLNQKSESFVRQFLEMLYVLFKVASAGNPVSIRDTGNTLRNVRAATSTVGSFGQVMAAAADVTYGIIIGTGNTAPTINDYAIEVIIPHATMNYSAMTIATPAADATTSQITITRSFSNVSGGAITVNEIALYQTVYDGAIRYVMSIRDVIVGGIAVPNGLTLTVNYRPQAVA